MIYRRYTLLIKNLVACKLLKLNINETRDEMAIRIDTRLVRKNNKTKCEIYLHAIICHKHGFVLHRLLSSANYILQYFLFKNIYVKYYGSDGYIY